MNARAPRLVAPAALALLLAACLEPPAPQATPSASPLGLYRAGALLFSDGTELYASSPDGGDRRRVTREGAEGFYAGGRWSPDGRLIAAERAVAGESGPQLALVDAANGSSERVSPAGTWLDGFAWSPDATRIVYATLTSGGTLAAGGTLVPEKGEIRLYDVGGRTSRVVGQGVHPSWSPDGSRIAYVHAVGAIAVSAPDGGDLKFVATLADLDRLAGSLAPKGFRLLSGPAWSRDAKRLAFSAIEGGPLLDALQVVFLASPAAGSPLRAYSLGRTGAQHHVVNLSWSPTADLLAYASIYAEPHHHIIGTIDPRESTVRPLFDSTRHFLDFTWAPDGSAMLLAIDGDHSLALIRPDRPSDDPPRLSFSGFRPDWCCPRRAQSP